MYCRSDWWETDSGGIPNTLHKFISILGFKMATAKTARSSSNDPHCANLPRKTHIQLVKYEDAPSYLQDNRNIWTGYRKHLTPKLCMESVFAWTNETINIWSHLLAFCIFFTMMVYTNIYVLPAIGADTWDHVVVTAGLFSTQFCMLASAGFHTFNCQSDHQYCKWLAWDINGVAISICGGQITGIYYIFYCHTVFSRMYIFIEICLFSIVIFQSLSYPVKFKKSEFLMHKVKVVVLMLYGLIPTVHFLIEKGWSHEFVHICLPRILTFYMLLVFSLLVYVGRIPECIFPGKVDCFGTSHNWWHFMVAVTGIYWYVHLPEVVGYCKSQGCL